MLITLFFLSPQNIDSFIVNVEMAILPLTFVWVQDSSGHMSILSVLFIRPGMVVNIFNHSTLEAEAA